MRRYRNAIRDRNLQVEGHRGLMASLSAMLVEKWEKLCIEWEKEPWPKKKPSPFHTEDVFLSEAQVRKELAEEEEALLASGVVSLHATTASMFIVLGLEIEEGQ